MGDSDDRRGPRGVPRLSDPPSRPRSIEEAYDRLQALEIHLANHIQVTRERLDTGAGTISRVAVKVEDLEQYRPDTLAERITKIEEDIKPKRMTLSLVLSILGPLMAIGSIIFMLGSYPNREEYERSLDRTYERIDGVKNSVNAVEKVQAKQEILIDTVFKIANEVKARLDEFSRDQRTRRGPPK